MLFHVETFCYLRLKYCFKTIPNGLDICMQLNAKPQFVFAAPNRTAPCLFIWVITAFHSALIETNNTSNSLQSYEIRWAFTHRSYSTYLRRVTGILSRPALVTGPKQKENTAVTYCHLLLSLHKSTELSTHPPKALMERNLSLSNVQPTDFLWKTVVLELS